MPLRTVLPLALLYLSTTFLHPFALHFLLPLYPHPSHFALLHNISISLSLWFWSLFGLFKPLPYTLLTPLPILLGFLSSIRSLLFLLSLTTIPLPILASLHLSLTSILSLNYHRLSTPTTPLALLFIATSLLALIHHPISPTAPACLILLLHSSSTLLIPLLSNLRSRLHASELQSQLTLRTWATVWSIPPVILDSLFNQPPTNSHQTHQLDDIAITLFFSTGLLAFWAFILSRAVTQRLSYPLTVLCENLAWLAVYYMAGGAATVAIAWLLVAAVNIAAMHVGDSSGLEEHIV